MRNEFMAVIRQKVSNYRFMPLMLLGIIILFSFLIRLRLLDFPLERDEGEYAYVAQLISQGIPPFSLAYNMKLPGTYVMYFLIMTLFGQTTQGIHFGLLLVNCLTVVMIFFFSRRIIDTYGAIIASATYAVLSLSPSVLGFAAHATHFVVLFAMGGALLLLKAGEDNKLSAYFWSGICCGLAFIMKQVGLFFVLYGILLISYFNFYSKPRPDKGLRNIFPFVIGSCMPFLLIVIWLYLAGTFDKFWFWTVEYAAKYATQIPLSEVATVFKHKLSEVTDYFTVLWIFSVLGFLALFRRHAPKANKISASLFAVCSFFTICPGFYFRPHYFITLLPAVSLLVGVFFSYFRVKAEVISKPYAKFVISGIFIAVMLAGIFYHKEYFFEADTFTLSKKIYKYDAFVESIQIAKYIKSRTGSNDCILVFGSEPQIYFYSQRRSSTGYIYTFSLMEKHEYSLRMQEAMIKEITTRPPKIIVAVDVSTSWAVTLDSEKYILRWFNNFIKAKYALVGLVDVVPGSEAIYRWDKEAQKYSFLSQNRLYVYERSL